jgi:hypothetical protein
METMKLPESWKEANVTPIQKKGPTNLVENDRPISLTSIVNILGAIGLALTT